MLRARQKLGKYRIVRRLSKGPLADVYQAYDTVLRARVALKIPVDGNGSVQDFVHEVRVAHRLEHPNILVIRDARYIDDKFVIVMELGEESLADRMERRMSRELAMSFASQALSAVALAHSHKIIHCDIKPENCILFPGNRLKLGDFGFAKISIRTLKASGSGTIDYIAPEQAMGRPKFQSDVFSLGLVLCRLFGGRLPEWPFDWPPAGIDRMKRWLPADAIDVLRKSIEVVPQKRYANAVLMKQAFDRSIARQSRSRIRRTTQKTQRKASWKAVQWKQFRRRYGKALAPKFDCRVCAGPVSESMQSCPWCGVDNPSFGEGTDMPSQCPRCERGVKRDWRYCAWCYGRGFESETTRRFADRRYTQHCDNAACHGPLMPFMKYCPWCKTRIRRRWKLDSGSKPCGHCGWGIADEFWDYCAWCGSGLNPTERLRAKRARRQH